MVVDPGRHRQAAVHHAGIFLSGVAGAAGGDLQRLVNPAFRGKRWRLLHRLVYAIAIGGVVHYFWLVKSDIREPLLYATILGLLYAVRLWAWWQRRRVLLMAVAQA